MKNGLKETCRERGIEELWHVLVVARAFQSLSHGKFSFNNFFFSLYILDS
jgi:hypothetical protein